MTTKKLTEAILLIDFSGEVRQEVAEHLRGLNYVVMFASTFEEALRQINSTDISLLILDAGIQEEFGETILNSISIHSPNATIALAVSDDTVPDKLGSYRTGRFSLLIRPVTPSVLEHTLRQIESHVRQLEKNSLRFSNTASEKSSLEALIQSLERQNIKLQTEHKKLTNASVQYRHKLFETQAKERQLSAVQVAIDSTREAVLILGADGRVHYSNAAFEEYFGSAQIDGGVYPIDSIFTDPRMNEKILSNIDILGTFSHEVSMIGHDGEEIHTYVNANSVHDETDAKPRRLYLITDLSEQEQLRKEAHHDALTGLYTRGYFLELLSTNISMSERHHHPLSVCLCDLDNFKQVNDSHGHRLGDRVLETFAWVVSQEIRNEDIAARIGGDEFIITFPQVEAATAATCMERIRKRFESITFTTDDQQQFSCSVTLGLADHPQQSTSKEELMELADKSLYHAKELGRNCTVVNMIEIKNNAA